MKAIRAQLAKIHIAQKQLGIDADTKLLHYTPYGVEHSNDLNFDEADELINSYIKAGAILQPTNVRLLDDDKDEYGSGKERYTMLDNRGYPYPKSSKLRKIEALWAAVSRTKTRKSLMIFVINKTGKSHLAFILDKDANQLLAILEAMNGKTPRQARSDN